MSTSESQGPRGRWWPPVLLLLAYAMLNLGGWWYYRRAEDTVITTVGERLLVSTQQVAGGLTLSSLNAWAYPSLDTVAHATMLQQMSDLGSRQEFESFSVFTPDGVLWLESKEDSLAAVSEIALAAGLSFLSAGAGEPMVSRPYASRGEYFLAACAPVIEDSIVVAVAVGEAGNEYFSPLRELRSGLVVLDAFAGLLFLAIGLIWMAIQRRLARAEAAAMRSAQLAAMGQMVATVAHELKNPLGIIKNTAERLRKKYGIDDEALFDFIPEEVDRLDAIVRRYLQFARLEVASGETVDLEALAAGLQSQVDPGDAELVLRIQEGATVTADPAALRQIFLNLLLNAIDACRSGGQISLSAIPRGSTVEIVIADTGEGMDAETLRRAAEPFFTTRTDGSGLGIYLAQTLTEKMGGRMIIKSRAGQGTSVTLILPAGDTEQP